MSKGKNRWRDAILPSQMTIAQIRERTGYSVPSIMAAVRKFQEQLIENVVMAGFDGNEFQPKKYGRTA